MNEAVKPQIESATSLMEKAISHLESELAKIRAGKASAQMLDGIFVDYYGSNTALALLVSPPPPPPGI
jgi:ribosome recycling factor